MIEPAAYGAAVSFGPHTWNFRDIVAALRTAGAAVAVDDFRELAEFVERCLDETDYRTTLGTTARSFVSTQRGATQRTVDLLEELVADQSAPRQSAA